LLVLPLCQPPFSLACQQSARRRSFCALRLGRREWQQEAAFLCKENPPAVLKS